MHGKSYRMLSTFSLIVSASGLLALMGGCPTGDFTLPGINQDPTANAGADITIDVGQRGTLNGLGSTDADDDPLTFSWQQRSGPPVMLDGANTPQPSFVPAEDGFYEFALTVTDGRGGSDISAVRVFVGDVDPATCPRADAGTDQMVNEGAAVRLRGGNSADPGGGPLAFDWFQLSGPQVSINGVFIVEPTFAAAQVTGADIDLEFELTVTNELGCPDRDTVVITVRDRDPGDPCNGVVCGDDGLFCNGVESCDDGACVSSDDPCSAAESCDEQSDACTTAACDTDANCDDGLFCNGAEMCVDGLCVAGTPPCAAGESCDEQSDVCTTAPCDTDADCDDDLFCNGVEICLDGSCVAGTNPCVLDANGLIAKWNLDGDAIDATGNGHDGVVFGATPAADGLGNPAGAMVFDGTNDYIEVPDNDQWAFGSNNFTIALWANFDSAGSGSIGRPGDVFIGNDAGSGTLNKWFFALGGGVLNFHINGPGIGSVFMPRAPFAPTVDQWYHLAVTRNGSTYTIFIDGDPAATAEDTRAIPNANASLMIGRANESWGGFMNGRLDEIAIYDRPLSDAQLQALFASGDHGSPSLTEDEGCDEETDSCATTGVCVTDADCDDGLFCNGTEMCVDGFCQVGTEPCLLGETCDEAMDECVLSGEETDTIRSSEWLTGAIDSVVDVDSYTFTGQVGERVLIQANRTSGGLNPVIDLFPPNGGPRETFAGSSTGSIALLFAHPLAESGQYTILVRDWSADGTGDYLMSLLLLSGARTSQQDSDGGAIAFDETKTAAIDPVVDMDAYTFTGQAGQRVTIQVNRTSGGLNPVIDLFPPSDGPRETFAGSSTGSIALLFAHPLAESGEYTVLVRDWSADGTGEYLLSLSVLP